MTTKHYCDVDHGDETLEGNEAVVEVIVNDKKTGMTQFSKDLCQAHYNLLREALKEESD